MLFIFRKLRRSFFQPGKVRTYFAYAAGEIALIVVGILIALEANEWKEERRDRIEENEMLQRISEELEEGIEDLTNHIEKTKIKKEALTRVLKAFEGEPIMAQRAFLEDVLHGAVYGYNQPMLPQTVFTELVNSGKLGLIESAILRKEISGYYDRLMHSDRLHGLKVTDYNKIMFRFIPHKDGEYNSVDNMDPVKTDAVANALLESELKNYVMAELNRSKILNLAFRDRSVQATQLNQLIQAEVNK